MGQYGDAYRANDHVTPPHAGDLVIFENPGEEDHVHIGIVVAYDPKTGKVYTVEGNTSGVDGCDGCVNYHSYNLYDHSDDIKRGYHMQGFCSNGGSSFGAITNAMKQAKPTVTIH